MQLQKQFVTTAQQCNPSWKKQCCQSHGAGHQVEGPPPYLPPSAEATVSLSPSNSWWLILTARTFSVCSTQAHYNFCKIQDKELCLESHTLVLIVCKYQSFKSSYWFIMEDQHYPSAWPNTLHEQSGRSALHSGLWDPQCLIPKHGDRKRLVSCHNPFNFSSALEFGTVFPGLCIYICDSAKPIPEFSPYPKGTAAAWSEISGTQSRTQTDPWKADLRNYWQMLAWDCKGKDFSVTMSIF